MIGSITGEIAAIRAGFAIVVCSGVGYKVALPRDALALLSPHTSISLWTHLAVRENALDLYGFLKEDELRFFELLLTVPGIGPKSAIAILNIADVETLRSAIAQGRAEYLTKVSGIGKKTAEKIVVELKDKAAIITSADAALPDEEALEAMLSLGYSSAEARAALRKVPPDITESNVRLREALKIIGKR